MAGFLEDRMRVFRFLSVIHFVGTSFLKLRSFTSVVKMYVCGEKEEIVVDAKRKRLDVEDESFAREVESFCYLFAEFGDVGRGFPDFHNFSLNSGKPVAKFLVSAQERCRIMLLSSTTNSVAVILVHELPNAVVPARCMNIMVTGHRRESATLMTIA